MIVILFFGRMADVIGMRRHEVADEDGLRLLALRDRLFAAAIAAGTIAPAAIHMSVNRVATRDDKLLASGDEVAFFSVFSGG